MLTMMHGGIGGDSFSSFSSSVFSDFLGAHVAFFVSK